MHCFSVIFLSDRKANSWVVELTLLTYRLKVDL